MAHDNPERHCKRGHPHLPPDYCPVVLQAYNYLSLLIFR